MGIGVEGWRIAIYRVRTQRAERVYGEWGPGTESFSIRLRVFSFWFWILGFGFRIEGSGFRACGDTWALSWSSKRVWRGLEVLRTSTSEEEWE